jgi:hypothetical protein
VYLGLRTLEFSEEIPTSDQAMVVVSGAYQYRVNGEMAALFFFGVENADEVIKQRLLSAARSAVSSKTAKDALEHKDAVSSAMREIIDANLMRDVGVETVDIPITVAPHKDVAAAFNAVQVAQRKQTEATALAQVKLTDARADAGAVSIRAGGQAGQLGRQAEGLLDMLSILTGKPVVSLPPEAALFLVTHFLGLQMRSDFARNGNNTAMVIPDDADMLKEMVNLLPTLVAHTGVEENDEPGDAISIFEKKATAGDDSTKAAATEFVAKLKEGADKVEDVMIDALPAFLRPWARKLLEAERRKANYGAK